MTQRFLVTGLPRSRTAWFAMLCSMMPGAYCAHEPISGMRRWQDMLTFLAREDWPYIGISDSSLAFHLDAFLPMAPRILIIDRGLDEVEDSLARLGYLNSRFIRALQQKLAAVEENSSVKWVRFLDLKDDDIVRECLVHLMPGSAVSMEKIALAQDMRIEADIDRVNARVEAQKHNLENLLGEDVAKWIRAPS